MFEDSYRYTVITFGMLFWDVFSPWNIEIWHLQHVDLGNSGCQLISPPDIQNTRENLRITDR